MSECPLCARSFADDSIMRMGVGGGVEGKHSIASRLRRTLEDAHALQPVLWKCEYERKTVHSIGTPGQSHHCEAGFIPSIHKPLIWETNPLNQIGLSCQAWLNTFPGCGCQASFPASVNEMWSDSNPSLSRSCPTIQGNVRLRAAAHHMLL